MGKYLSIFKGTFKEFGEDKVPRLGAALAYYTIFSIGPLLLISVAMAGIFFGREAAQGQIAGELEKVLGAKMADALQTVIAAAAEPRSGVIATIVGVVTLLIGASGVFGQLKDALNTIWNVEKKETSGIMGFIKDRFLSMGMVLGVGFLLLITLVLDAAISAAGPWLARLVGGEALMHVIQLSISFLVATVLFASIFRFLPDLKIAWRDVALGAVVTSLLFVIGKWGLGLYLGKAAVGSAYGAAGSLVILLVWVYWSSQIMLFGAEFTQVYARQIGSLRGDDSKRHARAGANKVEDRPRAEVRDGVPVTPPQPAQKQRYRKPKSGGGMIKLAAGGVAGLLLGALLGVVAVVGLVLKTLRKAVVSFR